MEQLTSKMLARSDRPSSDRNGAGFNSIPVRFGLMAALLAAICALAQALIWRADDLQGWPLALPIAAIGILVLAQASITVVAARKLTANINALRASTEAIAAGDLGAPIDVDCACEVGGLSDSFGKLVGRFNANLRRTNVLAHSDPLTGLPNRAVIAHLTERLAAAQQEGAVFFIDLDGFGKVNDAFGYRAGDQLLQAVGRRISEDGLARQIDQLDWGLNPFGEFEDRRPIDIAFARFAADQFVALIPQATDPAICEQYARAILRSLEVPFSIASAEIRISARIGIARLPLDGSDAVETLRLADLAMRAAKAGKTDWAFFEPALRDAALDRSRLESELRDALQCGELSLHYQPQVDCRSGRIVGVEALARWNHPTRGMVPPDVFIPIAEQTGLMTLLGRQVLALAVRQCAAWQQAGAGKRVAINISAVQLDEPGFADEVLALIAEHGVDPSLVEIEITESMAMSDTHSIRAHLIRLRAAGVLIAIDDFGTGYSNLSQLAKLPFTLLKIDKSLIAGIGRSAKEDAIVRAIINMGHDLGYAIVAEGVETQKQRGFLAELGCHVHQGYLLARPMPVDDFEQWDGRRALDALLARAHAQLRPREASNVIHLTPDTGKKSA
jgi:predicted signal transduction protein with EAL and GGDEF domain